MAITTGTITAKTPRNRGLQLHQCAIALDAAYPAGGYPLATVLAAVGKLPGHEIVLMQVEPAYPYTFGWDRANGKLVVYAEDAVSGITAEAAGDLSAVTGLVATILTI